MKDNITPKELMLKKIRQALLEKRDNPHPNLEDTALYVSNTEDLAVLFAEQLTAVSGNFIFCENDLEFIDSLLQLAEMYKWKKIYCWEPPLQNVLNHFEFPFYTNDQHFELADVGITLCENLIARNGSVLVSNYHEGGRRLSIYPHHHVVVAKLSQVVLDIKDGLAAVQNKYGTDIPSMISLITGPSRTADIEKTLVLGAHGPKELFVFLIDD
ncbi:MAG: LUD domain-containing protein [Sphingobacteriaceae bacterium]|nr:LUD domain-containing protein [Sphingobacteriaceae bacterium]